jgi:hypothetical protein
MKMQIRKWIAITFPVSLILCAGAAATTFAWMSVAKMTHAASVIVRARCVANTTRWDAGEIWTFTSFEIEDVWKGAAPPRIQVRLLGGRSGNLTSQVSGIPRFQAGEEVILFLEMTPRGDYSVVSWMQGTFRILRDRRAREERVTQDTAAFPTFDPVTHRFEAGGARNMPLSFFRTQVEAALRDEAGRKP